MCVAEVKGMKAEPSCLALLHSLGSGTMLLMGDEAGALSAFDLRMFGPSTLPV
ncbi:hypothetical protein HaLaN_29564, partial [Haematococcus lacustris]